MKAVWPLAIAAALLVPGAHCNAQPAELSTPGEEHDRAIAFGFAPPIGTVLRYEQTRSSTSDGQTAGAKLVYDYRFERRDGGYLIWAELTDIEGLGDERRAQLAETIAAPMLNVRYAIELSPDGEPLSIRDEDAVWTAMRRGIAIIEAEMRSRPNIGEDERVQMLDILAAIQAQDSEARRQHMLIVIADMITLAGRAITIGENPHSDEIASPLGGTVRLDGIISAEVLSEDMAQIEITGTANTAEQFIIRDQILYRAAPSSGLVHRMDRSRTFEAPADSGAPSYSETVMIRLIEEIPAANSVLPNAN